MLPLLLRLLLCLCLVVDTTAAAWAGPAAAPGAGQPPQATADAQSSMAVMAVMAASGCHDATGADHGAPAPDHRDHAAGHAHDGSCCKTSCDCLQHCAGAAMPVAALSLAPAPRAAPGWLLHSRRGEPAPYRPVRPPIA